MNQAPPTATLIHDVNCALCKAGVAWIRSHALPDAFEFLPSQLQQRRERFPWLTDAQCDIAVQLILPDGRTFAGDRALPEVFARMRGWRRVAWLAQWLMTLGLTAPFYGWIARHRHQFGCSQPQESKSGCSIMDARDATR